MQKSHEQVFCEVTLFFGAVCFPHWHQTWLTSHQVFQGVFGSLEYNSIKSNQTCNQTSFYRKQQESI